MRTEKGTVEFTNMVMVEDKATGRVLVQERRKSWTGLSFPGGHIEQFESIVDSAVREVKEETGLDVQNLRQCGVIHWVHKTRGDRYIVFLFRTNEFSGELLAETDEGKVFWIDPEKLKNEKLSKNFGNYIPMFFNDELNEAYGLWHEDEDDILIYK